MPILYKVITAVIAVTGCTGVIISGEVNPLMTLGGAALIPGYYRFLKGRTNAPGWAIGIFSVMALLVFLFDTTLISEDVFIAVAHLTIAFQAIKSFDLKEPWDHLQVYFVALLQMIIASELTDSVAFGALFVLFMVLLVSAMVFSHFLKEGARGGVKIAKPVLVISLLTLLITSLFFIVIPRSPFKFIGRSHSRGVKTTGFSERVDFGAFGTVKLDPTVVMRIEMERGVPGPYYWRGMTLDYFDGVSWRNSLKERHRASRSGGEYLIAPYDREAAVEQRIYLEPIDSDVIFGIGAIKGVKTDFYTVVESDMAGDVYLRGKGRGSVKYTVRSMAGDRYAGKNAPGYLQLPHGMKRIGDLARSLTVAATTDTQKAQSLEGFLKNNFSYSLSTSGPPEGMTPVEDFLFHSKRGYCEHYATAMVIMLRSINIPSRLVTGFFGGERNSYGGYLIVRQSDAHSWVEAFVDGAWRRFDPTPYAPPESPSFLVLLIDSVKMSWLRYVIGFSASDQKDIFLTLKRSFIFPVSHVSFKWKDQARLPYILVLLILSVSALLVVFRRLRMKRYGFVSGNYLIFRKFLKRKGMRILPSTTAEDIRKRMSRPEAARKAEEFMALYERCRFGGKEMGRDEKTRYLMLLKEVKKQF